MNSSKRAALLQYVAQMKEAGVTAIKIECEAQLRRTNDYRWDSNSTCHEWLLNRIQELTDTKLSYDGDAETYNPFRWMSFSKFYNDGSVDSEHTCTIKLNRPENVFYLEKVVQAFTDLGDCIGNGIDTQGAGLHMAFLFRKDASYPHKEDDYRRLAMTSYGKSRRLQLTKLRNFRKAMIQMLPALYFLGTTNEITRSMSFRTPRISIDYRKDALQFAHPKYAAISYRYGAMEFRIFDTCYDNPEAVFDYVAVMANASKYFVEPYVARVDPMKTIYFGNDSSRTLERLYGTIEHLQLLEQGVEALKPSWYTFDELKSQRNFTKSSANYQQNEETIVNDLANEYEEYSDRYDRMIGLYPPEMQRMMQPKETKTAYTARRLQEVITSSQGNDLLLPIND